MSTGYQRQRCSRYPEARLRVEYLVGSGTQDLFILAPLATPVYCEANDHEDFTPWFVWSKPPVADGCVGWIRSRR
eukprot:4529102-Pyramimonas_sp.AAC.2